MNFRIIPIDKCSTCNEVLIYLGVDVTGETFVKLVAWHFFDGIEYLQTSQIGYRETDNDKLMNKRLIADFSVDSATAFVNSFEFE